MWSLGPLILTLLLACTVASVYGVERRSRRCRDNQACAKLEKNEEDGTIRVEEDLCYCNSQKCSKSWDEDRLTWTNEERRSHKIQLSLCTYQRPDPCNGQYISAQVNFTRPADYRLLHLCNCEGDVTGVDRNRSNSRTRYITCPAGPSNRCVDKQACAKLTKHSNGSVTSESFCSCDFQGCNKIWDKDRLNWVDDEDRSRRIQLSFCTYQWPDESCGRRADSAQVIVLPVDGYTLDAHCNCERNIHVVLQKIDDSGTRKLILTCAARSLDFCVGINHACAKLTKYENGTVFSDKFCVCSDSPPCNEEWRDNNPARVTWRNETDRSRQIQFVFCRPRTLDLCNGTYMSARVQAITSRYEFSQYCACFEGIAEVYKKENMWNGWIWYLTCQSKSTCPAGDRAVCAKYVNRNDKYMFDCVCPDGKWCHFDMAERDREVGEQHFYCRNTILK